MMSRAVEARADAIAWRPFTNPFATRWTRPGAIPFRFEDGIAIDDLVRRLRESDWRGAIAGTHGSGKSTLLASLIPSLRAVGRELIVVQLRDGQRRLPLSRGELKPLGRGSILVIDGYEQLCRWRRRLVAAHCRRRNCGLLVTTHGECELPVIYRTEATISLVEQLIDDSLPPHDGRIGRDDIELAWRRHGGNVREVFFELYDRIESRPCSSIVRPRL